MAQKSASRVCNTRLWTAWVTNRLSVMPDDIKISSVEQDGGDGLIVAFSDGTIGGYVVEELLALRPIRERIKKPRSRVRRRVQRSAHDDVSEV